ncbi:MULTISPECIES: hypothetical protein [Proteus]|jgi:CRISPR/Cas system-associated endoribonuclease Cas2|uniref:Uncharacterized protein n=1 Tax=Proteus vulgaris TaxID=585 RepID=A0A379F5S9_PROVU|nr:MULTISPECIES: hypothetical protein [Proteus]NBN61269.1 hypothetical protein [Proteus sp. G2639]RNT27521.1 hypothetical protein B9475_009605 [Proteus mirabilis]AYY79821.1 hypothetical protein EGX81_02615 [Proteus vulgaris]KGA59417.1 hypothetical protein DR95_1634 [Proteus vulgaris]MBG5971796.1 hypothetical protein [Proteus vulgaris]
MLTTKTSGKVIGSLTQSWRYLLFLSLLPYLSTWPVFSLHFHNKLAFFVASVLFLLTQYSLFRLWLDSHLFQALYRYQDDVSFDKSLSTLFPKRPQKQTMEARWLGTKRLFSFAIIGISIQWIWNLVTLFITLFSY